ncbi:hypothetical protein L2E82_36175 [Cichorium intybus]|uniref:Uncharacterized protein n=1 Tax=Cichorium intybus TaxID=13427 RepID=A0ACB9BQU2_CICIN|nr:hypothetical protein L2E82_36175 [Cichorium intybus]
MHPAIQLQGLLRILMIFANTSSGLGHFLSNLGQLFDAVTYMLLACKYEEIYVPVVEDFIVISDRPHTRMYPRFGEYKIKPS